MVTGLLFAHGWGFDSHFWQPLRQRLRGYPQQLWDLGFFGHTEHPSLNFAESWIGIGHSQGFTRLILSDFPLRGVVGISGFTRFCATPPSSIGMDRRVLQAMGLRLTRNPQRVLREFYSLCGFAETDLPTIPSNQNQELLARELEKLETIDISNEVQNFDRPLLILAGMRDRVVPRELTCQCFEQYAECLWHKDAGHSLGASHDEWCATQIERFIRRKLC